MPGIVRNESLKLVANWLNAASVAVIGAGVFAPIVYHIYGFGPRMDNPAVIWSLVLICICVGVALHLVGRAAIGLLHDDE